MDTSERPVSPLTLPPYTFEPYVPGRGQRSLTDPGNPTSSSESSTLIGHIRDHYATTLNRSRWPSNPEYHTLSQNTLSRSASNLTDAPNGSGRGAQSYEGPMFNNTTQVSHQESIRPSTLQRSKLLMDALQVGEDILALYKRATDAEREKSIRKHLLNIGSGEIILKSVQFLRYARNSSTISEDTEKSLLNRILQLGYKLQKDQVSLSAFWSGIAEIVGSLQNLLATHHRTLGLDEIATRITEIESRVS